MSMVTERVKYFYAVTLALNLICTRTFHQFSALLYRPKYSAVMISYKIWQVQGEVVRYTNTGGLLRPKTGSRLVLIIIESGTLPFRIFPMPSLI